jgi:hypothetical protein
MNTKKTISTLLLNIGLAVYAIPAMAAPTVILDENWSNGTRNSQNLPRSSAWFSSGAMLLSVESGKLSQQTPDTNYVLTYFTDDKAKPVELKVGETLTIQYTFSLEGSLGSSFIRVGVFNSQPGVGRITTDVPSSRLPEFIGYQGYALSYGNIRNGTVDFRRRVDMGSSNIMSTLRVFESVGSSEREWRGLRSSVRYHSVLTFTRNANDMTLTATLADDQGGIYEFSRTDSNDFCSAFDTFAFMVSGSAADAFTLYDFKVSLNR